MRHIQSRPLRYLRVTERTDDINYGRMKYDRPTVNYHTVNFGKLNYGT